MVRRLFSVLMIFALMAAFAAPCFAGSVDHPNTVGQVQQDLHLFSFGVTSSDTSTRRISTDFFTAEDGAVPKSSKSLSDYSLGTYPYLTFNFYAPDTTGPIVLDGYLSFSAVTSTIDTVYICGSYIQDGWLYPTRLAAVEVYYTDAFLDLSNLFFNDIELDFSDYDYISIVLHNSNADANLIRSLTFSQSVGAQSVSLTPTSSSMTSSLKLNASGITSTGKVDIGRVSASYAGSIFSGSPGVLGFLKVVEASNGTYYIGFNNETNLDLALSNITTSDTLSGSASISGSIAASSYTGTASATTGTLTASTYSDSMAYGKLSVTYGDDGGLVDEVFDQGETLDDIAADMQQIIDDMNAQSDTANDIGSVTSESTIAGTQETLNSGSAALSSGLSVAGDVSSVSAPAGMYVGLLTATVTPLLNFGNGVLYWAFFSVVIGSVILFILRRLE